MKRLVVMLLLVCATPAQAARVWGDPVLVARPAPFQVQAAVGADGTTITTWVDTAPAANGCPAVFVRLGSQPPAQLPACSSAAQVAAGSGGNGVAAWQTASREEVALVQPDGTLTAPVDLGPGYPGAVAMNAAGDATVAIIGTGATPLNQVFTAFRPAGGVFGAPVALGGYQFDSLALSPDGETLVAMTEYSENAAPKFRVVSRKRDGAASASEPLLGAATGRIAIDGHGRVIVVGPGATGLDVAMRTADGTWRAPMASGLSANGVFDVKSDPAGDVVIAERAGFTSASLSVVTGSLAEGTLAPPALLDTAQGGDVSLGMGPDGTAVVVAGTSASREVRVFRRSSTGAFDPAVVAACLPAEGTGNSTVAGVQADGTTTLLVDAGLVRDAPSDAPGAVRTCPTDSDVTSREVHYSAQPTVGVPVDVTADIHRTGYDVTDYQFVFAPTDPAGAFTAAPTVRHTFPGPGVQTFTVYATEVARETGRMTNAAFSFTVDVFAPPTLTAARFQRRHAVFRHGVVGTANAFVGAQTADVTLVVRGRGQVLGRSTTKLGSTPAPFAVALTKSAGRLLARHDSTAALIILRQGGKVLLVRKVRID